MKRNRMRISEIHSLADCYRKKLERLQLHGQWDTGKILWILNWCIHTKQNGYIFTTCKENCITINHISVILNFAYFHHILEHPPVFCCLHNKDPFLIISNPGCAVWVFLGLNISLRLSIHLNDNSLLWRGWGALNTSPRMPFSKLSNKFLAPAWHNFPANEIEGSWIHKCDVAVFFSTASPWICAKPCKVPDLEAALQASVALLFNSGLLRRKVHDGSCRWHSSLGADHACPSRVLQWHRFGLLIPGLAYPSCPDQHPPAGGGHVSALQRLAVSRLPEEQRKLLRRWGRFAGTFFSDVHLSCWVLFYLL